MDAFEHGFTHFRLHVQPVRCNVRKRRPDAGGAASLWLPLAEAGQAAVPTPVRALLSRLVDEQAP